MSRGSVKLKNARKKEIINAFEELYNIKSLRNISMREIGEKTSMTRSSIYNYFQTKEEIFLGLIVREFQSWSNSLKEIAKLDALTVPEFAHIAAETLSKRRYFLKLISWNHYELAENSRIERISEVQQITYEAMKAIMLCLNKFFPSISTETKNNFIQSFFIFLYGIDSYINGAENQQEAMQFAGIHYHPVKIYDVVYTFILHYLKQEDLK